MPYNPIYNLTGKPMASTYGQIMETDGSGSFYNGLGTQIFLTASAGLSSSYATTASYAITASYALNAGSGTTLTTASTYPITSSWANSSINSISASWASSSISSSWSNNSKSASYITSSGIVGIVNSASYAITSSWSNNSLHSMSSDTASFAITTYVTQSISYSISASWASRSFWATSASFASQSLSSSYSPIQLPDITDSSSIQCVGIVQPNPIYTLDVNGSIGNSANGNVNNLILDDGYANTTLVAGNVRYFIAIPTEKSINLGFDSSAAGFGSITLGNGGAVTEGDYSTTVGYGCDTNGSGSLTLGNNSSTNGNNSVTIGNRLFNPTDNIIVIGNNQNVGINTNTPQYTLDVNGLIGNGTTNGGVINFGSNSLDSSVNIICPYNFRVDSASDFLYFDVNGNLYNGNSDYKLSTYGNSSWLNANGGFVGIKTKTPAYTLDVSGSINFTTNLLQNGLPYTASLATTASYVKNAVSSSYALSASWAPGGGSSVSSSWASSSLSASYSPTQLPDITDNVVSHSIGINQSNPQYPLDINGSINYTGNIYRSGLQVAYFNNSSTFLGVYSSGSALYSTAIGFMSYAAGFRSTAVGVSCFANQIDSTAIGYNSSCIGMDSVSIGADASAGQTSICIGMNSWATHTSSITLGYNSKNINNNSIIFGNNINSVSDNTIILGSGQNVGINITNPTNSLDVGGNISCSVVTASLFYGTASYSITSSFTSVSNIANNVSQSNLVGTSSLYSQAFILTGSYTKIITGSYTLTSNENGKLLIVNSGSSVNLTVPNTLPQGFACSMFQSGSGQATISGSGVNIRNRSGLSSSYGQYSVISLLRIDNSNYLLQGDIG